MNRRDFTALSALTMASASLAHLPRALAGDSAPAAPAGPVGFAAVGLGTICDLFMRACTSSSKAKITALVTDNPDTKGAHYADLYGIPNSSIYTYDDFDRIRDNRQVEAVYIGLPNSLHRDFTLRAAQAGKHVLCEKPMAVSSTECRTMIDACHKAGVKLMIAYRVQYDPTWNRAIELIKSGVIGQLQSFQGGFLGQQAPGAWRLSRTLGGGGALLDLGIYPLNAIRHITGEEPSNFTAVVATRDTSGRFAEVEQSMEWTMKFPSGILASCGCSYGQSGNGFLNVYGDKGYLALDPGFYYDGVHLRVFVNYKQVMDEFGTGKVPFQFTLEADHFADCIRHDKQPESPGEEGLKDMLAIEAIYRAAGASIA